jgi:superfamily II DNA or RNA helicase
MTLAEGFFKDYSWQERAIEALELGLGDFYNRERGKFKHPFVLEVSPSGGKSVFALKAARMMIEKNLADKVFFIVPRESIKNGFQDDSSMVEMRTRRILGQETIRIDTSLASSDVYGSFSNYHGAVINYQSLGKFISYFKLLSDSGIRLLFVFDEVHHGAVDMDGVSDECQNEWAKAMNAVRSIAHAVICMTGTPVRTDRKGVPFFRYDTVVTDGEQTGRQVKADFKFTYKDAIEAGVARCAIFRFQNPKVEFSHDDKLFDGNLENVPRLLIDKAKRELFSSANGHTVEMLKRASEENKLHKLAGDDDAAILVVVGNKEGSRNPLEEVAEKIQNMFGEVAITVESADASSAEAIKDFKRNTRHRWIVAKDMISEGTSIPRIRTVLILRDIQSRVKFEQTIHRATRNRSDISPQDAIVIFYHLPDMAEFARTIESSIRQIKLKPVITCPSCDERLEFRPRNDRPCPHCAYQPKGSEKSRAPTTETPDQVSAAIAAAAGQLHHPGHRLNIEEWRYEREPEIEVLTPPEVSALVASIAKVPHMPGSRFNKITGSYDPDPILSYDGVKFCWISSKFGHEEIIQSGETYTKYDPTSRGFLAQLGSKARGLGRDLINQVLAYADNEKPSTEPALTIDEQVQSYWNSGRLNIRSAAMVVAKRKGTEVGKEIAFLTNECKFISGMGKHSIDTIRRSHPDPVSVLRAFEENSKLILRRTQ